MLFNLILDVIDQIFGYINKGSDYKSIIQVNHFCYNLMHRLIPNAHVKLCNHIATLFTLFSE